MSVGKASIRRAAGAESKPVEAAPIAEKKTETAVPEKTPVKKAATKPDSKASVKKPVAKSSAKAPAKAPVKKAPAAPVKKAESKAGFGAVGLTEEMPYYLL